MLPPVVTWWDAFKCLWQTDVIFQILRAMRGYDEQNTILLPPREPGEDLPKELFEAYNEMRKKKESEKKDSGEIPNEDNVFNDSVAVGGEVVNDQVVADKDVTDAKSEEEIESDKEGRLI